MSKKWQDWAQKRTHPAIAKYLENRPTMVVETEFIPIDVGRIVREIMPRVEYYLMEPTEKKVDNH